MKILITLTLLAFPLCHNYGAIIDSVVITGRVQKVSSQEVEVKDKFGQIHKVERKFFPKDMRLVQHGNVSFTKRIDIQKLTSFDYTLQGYQKLSTKQKMALYRAYAQFNQALDEETLLKYGGTLPLEKGVSQTFPLKDFFNRFAIDSVWAVDGTLNCLYGGWPSIIQAGTCQAPWLSSSRSAARAIMNAGRAMLTAVTPIFLGRERP